MRNLNFLFSSILFLVSLSFLASSSYASSEIKCFYEDGGYDDEYIYLLSDGGIIESLKYDSYGGTVGPFVKESVDNTFFHTTEKLVIRYMATISPGRDGVTLSVFYKDGMSLLDTRYFICK
jgi:hypothetical protein